MVLGWYRYSPPQHPPGPHYPGYTLPVRHWHVHCRTGMVPSSKCAVGLKSVEQLSLSAEFSGFRGMTEVYNLLVAGNPDDHK